MWQLATVSTQKIWSAHTFLLKTPPKSTQSLCSAFSQCSAGSEGVVLNADFAELISVELIKGQNGSVISTLRSHDTLGI